jgi:hypothetical protein
MLGGCSEQVLEVANQQAHGNLVNINVHSHHLFLLLMPIKPPSLDPYFMSITRCKVSRAVHGLYVLRRCILRADLANLEIF